MLPQDELIARFLASIGVEVIGLVEEVISSFPALDITLFLMRNESVHCTCSLLAENVGRPLDEIREALDKLITCGLLEIDGEDADTGFRISSTSGWYAAAHSLADMYETDLNFRLWLIGKLLQPAGGDHHVF